jgi:hypothetical protein
VLGGEDDGTEAELIPRVGHDMMLEPEGRGSPNGSKEGS